MILVLLLLLSLLGWCAWRVLGNGGPKAFVAGKVLDRASVHGAAAAVAGASSDTSAADLGAAFSPRNREDPVVKPVAVRTYRFEHREPPAPEDLKFAGSLGVDVMCDRLSRVAVVQGDLAGVEAALRFLEEIDVPAGSCAAQTWAVYVDRSVQKGFDLVAAIGAVTGASTVDVGGGTLAINVGAGEMAAALDVIADGAVVEVIQRPHVQLQQGVEASVESIQEVPVPSTSVSQGIAQTSVEYRKVGLQLHITPYFLDRDRLRMAVNQTNGLIGRNVNVGGNDVPIIESQTVKTTVEMSVGQAVVLGGVSTLRRKSVKGLLRDRDEISEGCLYVVVATTQGVPRAVVVGSPEDSISPGLAPFGVRAGDADEWLDGMLLPPLPSHSGQAAGLVPGEGEFLRSRRVRGR